MFLYLVYTVLLCICFRRILELEAFVEDSQWTTGRPCMAGEMHGDAMDNFHAVSYLAVFSYNSCNHADLGLYFDVSVCDAAIACLALVIIFKPRPTCVPLIGLHFFVE